MKFRLACATIPATLEPCKPQGRHWHGMVATIGTQNSGVLPYARPYFGFADHV